MNVKITPDVDKDFEASFMQVKPKNTSGAPDWYAPNRDMLKQFPFWMHISLKRFDKLELTEEETAALGEQCKGIAGIVNAIKAGDMAGNVEKLGEDIKKLQEANPEAFASVGGMFLAHMLNRYWWHAGEASLRDKEPMP